jgi:hypothetical protein
MSLATWKCLTCGKDFTVGEWLCADGQSNHIVASKEYLLADAPSDPGHPAPGSTINVALREGRTLICGIPPDERVVINGEVTLQLGGSAEFFRGRFTTADPQKQYYLDKKGGFCSEAQWEHAWLSQDQQLQLERGKLDAMKQRLENDRNELLAQVKQQKTEKVATAR